MNTLASYYLVVPFPLLLIVAVLVVGVVVALRRRQ
jgi:hypothetical protein